MVTLKLRTEKLMMVDSDKEREWKSHKKSIEREKKKYVIAKVRHLLCLFSLLICRNAGHKFLSRCFVGGFLSEYLMLDVYYRLGLGDMSSAIYGHRVKCDVDSQFMIISEKFISTRFRNEFTISIGHSIKCNDQNLLFISNSRGNYFDLIQLRLSALWFHRQVGHYMNVEWSLCKNRGRKKHQSEIYLSKSVGEQKKQSKSIQLYYNDYKFNKRSSS